MTTLEAVRDDVRQEFERLGVPDHEHDAAWVVRGVRTDLTGPVVFLVHPTTAGAGWFGDPDDAEARAEVSRVVREQLSAFPGEVWAPRYRQASTRAFHRRDEGGELAYDLAQDDVARAFSQFLADDSRRPGAARPLVLVGHSQGARHVRALVEEFFDHPTLASRLVAAYVVGVGVAPEDELLARFPLADGPDGVGVSVVYQARLARTAQADPAADPAADPVVCVAPSTLGLAEPGEVSLVGTHLEFTPERAGKFASAALPDGRLHHVEIPLLAEALACDVRRRTRAWRAAQPPGEQEPVPVDAELGFVATPITSDTAAVEHWPGVTGRNFSVPGGRIHVVDLPGPEESALAPVVLLHKLGGWAAEWRAVATDLAAERRVVVVDLPGHGGSVQDVAAPWVHWPQETARTLRSVLARLGVRRAHLLGCSLGGVVALCLAERAARGEVLSTALVGTSVTPRLSAARTLEIDRTVRPGFGPGWVPRPGQNSRAATRDAAVLAEQDASRARAGVWVRCSERGVGLSGAEQVLAGVDVEVMYLNGERAGYRAYEDTVRALVPSARIEVVADAGAFVHQEQPAELAARWRRFVGRA